jgi:lysozyme
MRFEGWSARQYPDQTGHPTIGFGHLIQPGETFPEPLTREQGIALLCLDIARIVNPALDLISVPLEQHQVDALASFIFNVGNGAFGSSTLLILLNQGNYDAVPGQLARWVYSNGQRLSGLVRRRAEEAALFGREERGAERRIMQRNEPAEERYVGLRLAGVRFGILEVVGCLTAVARWSVRTAEDASRSTELDGDDRPVHYDRREFMRRRARRQREG